MFLVQVQFATSKTNLDIYYNKLENVVSKIAEQFGWTQPGAKSPFHKSILPMTIRKYTKLDTKVL